jgi:hypothetical protein
MWSASFRSGAVESSKRFTTVQSRIPSLALLLGQNSNFVEDYFQKLGTKLRLDFALVMKFWGAQAAGLQVSAACRDPEMGRFAEMHLSRMLQAGLPATTGFATANPSCGGLAACAPQKRATGVTPATTIH